MVKEFLVTPKDKEPVLSLLRLRLDPWPSLPHTKSTDKKKKKRGDSGAQEGREGQDAAEAQSMQGPLNRSSLRLRPPFQGSVSTGVMSGNRNIEKCNVM